MSKNFKNDDWWINNILSKGNSDNIQELFFLSLKCINSSLIIPYHQSVQTNNFSYWDSKPFVSNNKNTARDRHCGNKRGRLCLKGCAVSLWRFLSQFSFGALPPEETIIVPVNPNPRWTMWTAAKNSGRAKVVFSTVNGV